jgi:hypothetical protein
MFSYSTGYYVSPPDDQYLKFKNRCSLKTTQFILGMHKSDFPYNVAISSMGYP